jgi:hypothetical protein
MSGTLRKKSFSTTRYVEIHIQRQFFDNKKGIWKTDVLKIQTVSTYLSASFTYKINFFSKKIKIPNFGGISKFIKLIVFGQISALLGRFCCICSG